jgi:hypothetical protein
MPVALFAVLTLLAVQAYAALRAGNVTTAGVCLGGIAFAALQLKRWYRAHGGRLAPVRGRVLLAIVYPDQLDGFGNLLAVVDVDTQDVVVLVIDPCDGIAEPRSNARLVSPTDVLRDRDPRLTSKLARVMRSAHRPVSLLRAVGPDPALVVLDVAQKLGVARLVALRAEDSSADEQRRRCTSAWESLPSPRPVLRIDLISARGDAPMTLELAPGQV